MPTPRPKVRLITNLRLMPGLETMVDTTGIIRIIMQEMRMLLPWGAGGMFYPIGLGEHSVISYY